jgi:hypothetical protein
MEEKKIPVGELTKEMVIEALLEDPEIISAEYRDGEFHVVTTFGPKSFKLSFKRPDGAETQ